MIDRHTHEFQHDQLTHVAFPLGGIGAGMFCLEGNGGLNHFSLRSRPQLYYEPGVFASVTADGNRVRVAEGPLQPWKVFGPGDDRGNGIRGRSYSLPRFRNVSFASTFPFAKVRLDDGDFPFTVQCTGWSPFSPGDADDSSLPVAALEYSVTNTSSKSVRAVFGFHIPNFVGTKEEPAVVSREENRLIFSDRDGGLSASVVASADVRLETDPCWFRGAWFDAGSMLWQRIRTGTPAAGAVPQPGEPASPGGSFWAEKSLAPTEFFGVTILLVWYFPNTTLTAGERSDDPKDGSEACSCDAAGAHRPWYASRFADLNDVASYFVSNLKRLRSAAERFADCFSSMEVPREIAEAVGANLSIIKSPTLLRDPTGRLWGWEGCFDNSGCCYGSCTHVWNYAQAIPHLFPALERGMRETEFHCSQTPSGHQNFRTALPIAASATRQIAASDGQLGGIVKVYREWRISSDNDWLRKMWPYVKGSLDFSIRHWDPGKTGTLREAHHNTYDIEFWGPDGMCGSIYLAALAAAARMGAALGKDVAEYEELLRSGKMYLESRLFNGEYFFQEVEYRDLTRPYDPAVESSPEGMEVCRREGPKYQYGTGCLADGIIGEWMANAAGLPPLLDRAKVRSHLLSVFRYNFALDRHEHGNPQRAGYSMNDEGGLLLCTWPRGGEPSLPFVYSHEVWTGIEYQVAAHLVMAGCIDEGMQIVRACRSRYDGVRRNPFDEYECGHWYARALASYSLLQAISGVRYDAVEAELSIDPRIPGDVMTFLATETGYGLAGIRGGKPALEVWSGTIAPKKVRVAGSPGSIESLLVIDRA